MANYVKFYRGTQAKYDAAIKQNQVNDDTLYFITDAGFNKGALYLGDMLISRDITDFSEIPGLDISKTLKHKDLLVYDAFEEAWVNKSILDAIGVFLGAQDGKQGTNGLVPAPIENGENLFLRGDGTWAMPEGTATISIDVDKKSVSFIDEKGTTIGLNNFGKKYYKYVAATDTEAAHYIEQIVDNLHPWLAGLEIRTVEENGEIVLGWFEPDPTTIEGINSQFSSLQSNIDSIKDILGSPATEDQSATGLYAKADSNSVYTKEETERIIATELAKSDHLIRKTFVSIKVAEEFITTTEKPENYIYMISSGDVNYNKYDEYLYINNSLEKIGAWETDLTNYVTKEEFENKITSKLENKIETVDENEFNLINGHLSLNTIAIGKVTSLENILAAKAEKAQVEEVKNSVNTFESKLNFINTKVVDLENILKNSSFITQDELTSELAPLKDAVTWQDI